MVTREWEGKWVTRIEKRSNKTWRGGINSAFSIALKGHNCVQCNTYLEICRK